MATTRKKAPAKKEPQLSKTAKLQKLNKDTYDMLNTLVDVLEMVSTNYDKLGDAEGAAKIEDLTEKAAQIVRLLSVRSGVSTNH
jgi:hypothetical protein